MTKGKQLFSTTAVKEENPILPGYVPGTDGMTTPIPITQDGWLRIMLSTACYASETRGVKIRVVLANSASKETLSFITTDPGTSMSSCDFVPIKAGQTIAFACFASDFSDINGNKSWLGIAFYPMLSM